MAAAQEVKSPEPKGQTPDSVHQLLLGCGANREKKLVGPGGREWVGLVTLDLRPDCGADHVFDLGRLSTGARLPFPDGHFSEIHAYEVLEHFGTQGDAVGFFAEWAEFWRVLAPGGCFFATVPRWDSLWAWGDPGHRRVINEGALVFLDQAQYPRQLAAGAPMTDYRGIWTGDLETVYTIFPGPDTFGFVLQARKG